MSKRDYYEILEVSRSVTHEELKRAYRRQARQFHPDYNPGNPEAEIRFKEINEAFDILKDPQKRAAYDRHGHQAFSGGGFGGFGGSPFDEVFSGGLGDIFEQMFGVSRSRGGRSRRGNDLQTSLTITLQEAFSGAEKELSIQTQLPCKACKGTGSRDKQAGSRICPACQGAGAVRVQRGFFVVEQSCPSCHGSGRKIEHPCPACHGETTLRGTETVAVSIPSGIESGTRLKLGGRGETGHGGAGDLYIDIEIKTDRQFQRQGPDLHAPYTLRMAQAALGDEVKVPVIEGGHASLRIPPGTQNGAVFQIRGRGFSILHSKNRGDLYIQARVETPTKLSPRQKELLESFEAESGFTKSRSSKSGLIAKTRDFFDGR